MGAVTVSVQLCALLDAAPKGAVDVVPYSGSAADAELIATLVDELAPEHIW